MRAQVTIDLEEYQAIRDKGIALEREVASLRESADVSRLGDEQAVLALHEAFLASTEIVTFAIANLDPLAFRGWPHVALRAYAEALAIIPALPQGLREISADLVMFSETARKWEDARARGVEQQLLAEEDRREVRRKARLAAAQPAVAAPAVAVAAAEVDETDDEPDHGADVEDADDDAEPLSEDGGDPVAATPSASSAAASSGVPGEKPSATPERVGRRSRGAGKAPTAPAGE